MEAKGVVVGQDLSLKFSSLSLRSLGDDDVLIKVHSAPINPADIGFSKGKYPAKKPLPNFMGFEGSGVVESSGAGEHAQSLLGKRVTFFSREPSDIGTWGEKTVVTSQTAYEVPGDLTYEEAACCLVNPLTAQSFVYICQRDQHRAMVHSAGASALGKMLVFGAKQAGIGLICIVRREEQVLLLKKLGAEHVLNSNGEGFDQEFGALCESLGANIFFDAVSGKDGSRIVSLMPNGSKVQCYGRLSGEDYSIPATELIFKNKSISGFWLTPILKNEISRKAVISVAFENLANRNYTTNISKKFPFENFDEAIDFYSKNQTEGKVLLQNANF